MIELRIGTELNHRCARMRDLSYVTLFLTLIFFKLTVLLSEAHQQLDQMKALTLKVNQILKALFLSGDMLLVDFKLEFGVHEGQLILGDEFSPDGCRLWDVDTRKKMDKDRFRQGLGSVVETYIEVAQRIGVQL